MSPTQRDPRDAEAGVALITALFAMVILLGLAALFVAMATNQSRFTGIERDFENALPVAEAGIDQVVLRLNENRDFYGSPNDNAPASGGPNIVYDPSTVSDERAWAIAQAAALTVRPTGRGETASFRPVHVNYNPADSRCADSSAPSYDVTVCEPLKVIYSVGYVPSRANPVRIRVVRAQYDQLLFQPDHAVAVKGNCDLNSGVVGGFRGDVYCDNGSETLPWGNTAKVEGKLTATGNVNPNPGIRASSCNFENSCANGTVGSFEEFATRMDLPEIDVRTMYGFSRDTSLAAGWYDLCPPGTPDARATIRSPGATPCSGSLLWTDGDTNNYRGWDYRGSSNDWSGNNVASGVYYAYQREIGANGAQPGAAITVLAEADPADSTGAYSGNIDMRGNLSVGPAAKSLLFVADRDVVVNGNSGSQLQGFIAAHEQMSLSGSASLLGAAYAEDAPHTSASPVGESVLTGGMTIRYDGGLTLELAGIVRITAWNEL